MNEEEKEKLLKEWFVEYFHSDKTDDLLFDLAENYLTNGLSGGLEMSLRYKLENAYHNARFRVFEPDTTEN